MLRKSFCTAVLALALLVTTVIAVAEKIIVLKSEKKTSNDIPLEFILEKTKWDGTDIWIWGSVENTASNTFENVKVIFTVKGSAGKFIGRKSWDTDPPRIKPGQIGFIDERFVRCERKKPSYIEYNVTAE
jgi:hypothetical protein